MELREVQGGIFGAFFGAAYSVIIFGPLILPLTVKDFINQSNLILLGTALVTLVVSFWGLIRNSIAWVTEREFSVHALFSNKEELFEDLMRRKGEITQNGIFIFIILPGAAILSGMLSISQIILWIIGIMTLLTIQFIETLS